MESTQPKLRIPAALMPSYNKIIDTPDGPSLQKRVRLTCGVCKATKLMTIYRGVTRVAGVVACEKCRHFYQKYKRSPWALSCDSYGQCFSNDEISLKCKGCWMLHVLQNLPVPDELYNQLYEHLSDALKVRIMENKRVLNIDGIPENERGSLALEAFIKKAWVDVTDMNVDPNLPRPVSSLEDFGEANYSEEESSFFNSVITMDGDNSMKNYTYCEDSKLSLDNSIHAESNSIYITEYGGQANENIQYCPGSQTSSPECPLSTNKKSIFKDNSITEKKLQIEIENSTWTNYSEHVIQPSDKNRVLSSKTGVSSLEDFKVASFEIPTPYNRLYNTLEDHTKSQKLGPEDMEFYTRQTQIRESNTTSQDIDEAHHRSPETLESLTNSPESPKSQGNHLDNFESISNEPKDYKSEKSSLNFIEEPKISPEVHSSACTVIPTIKKMQNPTYVFNEVSCARNVINHTGYDYQSKSSTLHLFEKNIQSYKIHDAYATSPEAHEDHTRLPEVIENNTRSSEVFENHAMLPEIFENNVRSPEAIENHSTLPEVIENNTKSSEVIENNTRSPKVIENHARLPEVIEKNTISLEVFGAHTRPSEVIEKTIMSSEVIENTTISSKVIKTDTKSPGALKMGTISPEVFDAHTRPPEVPFLISKESMAMKSDSNQLPIEDQYEESSILLQIQIDENSLDLTESENMPVGESIVSLEATAMSSEKSLSEPRKRKLSSIVRSDILPSNRKRMCRERARVQYFTKIRTTKKLEPIHDINGTIIATGINLCDCLVLSCPGCHFPCPKCQSPKCGPECRTNRSWYFESIETEGMKEIRQNVFIKKP